jgi:glycosyltransferase involved in cell wall biosynthesis
LVRLREVYPRPAFYLLIFTQHKEVFMHHSSKPVLLYIITKSDIGGAQGNAFDLIKAFQTEYDVHLAVGETGPLTDDVQAIGVPVHIIPNLTRKIQLLGDFYCVKQCIDLIQSIRPSIIHAHSSKAGIVARLAGWFCQVPVFFTAHGWGFSSGTPKLRRMIAWIAEALIAPITTQIICVSEQDRQLALRWRVGNSRILTTIRYGIVNLSDNRAQPAQEPVRLVMVARFNEQKDQATLLKAIAHLNANLHLDLIGSGPSFKACQALAQSLGITDRVSFLGDRRDVPELLCGYQIFILSTHYEGLPISILEAMRAGLPVIATEVNGIPEEVIAGKTGLLVPPGDAAALARAIDSLLPSPALRAEMGKAARARFEQDFSLEQMVDKTRRLYANYQKHRVPSAERLRL